MKTLEKREIKERKEIAKPKAGIAKTAAFAAAFFGSTMMGCATVKQAEPVPTAKAEQALTLPKEIEKGNGLSYLPYEVDLRDKKQDGVAGTQIVVPIVFDLQGTEINFEFHVTANQLRKNNIEQTKRKMRSILRDVVDLYVLTDTTKSFQGAKVAFYINPVFDKIIENATKDPNLRRYLF